MDVMGLLDYLTDEVQAAGKVPFSTNCMVDREKILNIINDIRRNLPEEMVAAADITKRQDQILDEAQQDARRIRDDAAQHADELVEQNEITQAAYERAREILDQAQRGAEETRLSANQYADDILSDMDAYISQQLNTIRITREHMQGQ